MLININTPHPSLSLRERVTIQIIFNEVLMTSSEKIWA